METLTKRQGQVLKFMSEYHVKYSVPPTVREIADAMGIGTPNGVMCHLRFMEKERG